MRDLGEVWGTRGSWLQAVAAIGLASTVACGSSPGEAEGLLPWPDDAAGLDDADDQSCEGEAEGSDSEPGPPPPKFDITSGDDLDDRDAYHSGIPSDCAEAANHATSVGCWFHTVDLDNKVDSVPFAAVVSNVQDDVSVTVVVDRRVYPRGQITPSWERVAGPVTLEPLTLHEFHFDDFHHEGAGKRRGGAYRIQSDRPIVAYQFNPIDGANSLLSDASMLYPVASWDYLNHVVGWAAASSGNRPFVTVAAAHDGTRVTITPAVATLGGTGVAAAAPGQPIVVELDAGDTASVTPVDDLHSLTGTVVASDSEHPVAVFSGHSCANIPGGICCCDHLEDQLSGLRSWGRSFVAAHMPTRMPAEPEATLWQIYAAEDGTRVEFEHVPGLVGLPGPRLELDAGEVAELFVSAPAGIEADFQVHANHPIAVVSYMTSSHNLAVELYNDGGDPAMVQLAPVEQFLSRYVILVPGTWIHDVLILTRAAGAEILLDGLAVSDAEFEPVGDGDWEAARIRVSDGVHHLDGRGVGFGVVVVGWDQYDSYAYLGGTGTARINPQPEG